jgi:hypothetical protein
VTRALLEGALFVSIVLFLFLLNLRTTVISLVAIPLSLLVTVITLKWLGLTINTPRWSTFTSVQLRDADKGPWRVEITDKSGNLMHTLRFSITD